MVIRTDLALEAREMIDEKRSEKMRDKDALPKGMLVKTRENNYILITDIEITSEEAAKKIGKKIGKYLTLEFKNPILDTLDNQENIAKSLSTELTAFISELCNNSPVIMIAGLGNRNITADSLGPKVVDKVVVTRHVKNIEKNDNLEIDARLGNLCAVAPGVMGVTGIETSEMIKGMISTVKPDILIVIDALASRKTSRVNTTIQISDTGIVPGSGVGNHRMELSQDVLGIPVIAIGVPTVVDAATLVRDILEISNNDNNLKLESENEIINMIVTPKNIDIAIERLSEVISSGINMAIHKGFEMKEINEYLI